MWLLQLLFTITTSATFGAWLIFMHTSCQRRNDCLIKCNYTSIRRQLGFLIYVCMPLVTGYLVVKLKQCSMLSPL